MSILNFFRRKFDSFLLDLMQLRGIMLNSIHLQLRQYKSNIASILIPVVCMVYVEVLQLMYNYVVASLDINGQLTRHDVLPFQPYDLEGIQFAAGYGYNTTFPNEIYVVSENFTQVMEYLNDLPDDTAPVRFKNGTIISRDLIHLLISNSTDFVDIDLFEKMTKYESKKNYPMLGSWLFHAYNKTDLEYTLQYNFSPLKWKNKLYGFIDDVSEFCKGIQLGMNTRGCQGVISVSLMDYIHNLFLKKAVNYKVETKVEQLPYKQIQYKVDMNLKEYFEVILFPLCIAILVPIFVFKLINEKTEKYREMMKLMGMRQRNYVISNLVFMFFTYCISAIIFNIFGAIFKYRLVTQTNIGILIIVYICGAFSVISLSHLIAAIINSTLLGSIVGFFFVLIIPIVGFVLENQVMNDRKWGYKPLLLFQTLPITDAIFRLSERCQVLHCLEDFNQIYLNTDLFIALLFMIGDSILYFIAALYLDVVIPKTWGRKRSPLFFLEFITKHFKRKKERDLNPPRAQNEDEDVKVLRDDIMAGKITKDDQGILVDGLIKKFKKNFAVNGVYLNVKKNEIMGLLGPNGAGKTTLIRCLVGLYSQSKGEAYVSGKSISDDMNDIRRSLGYCPQFNILFDDLTPTEHLLFYSRIKGVNILKERKHAQRILKSIGLAKEKEDNWFVKILQYFFNTEKKVSQLSEGLKRRLAIACALTGDPKVVILDEPTTGLDTSSQRKIWKIIINEKKSKSILITTHSMEEADVLSDKIAIMSKGNLVCCGNSVRLKSRFGSGYIINLNSTDKRKTKYFLKTKLRQYRLKKIKEFGDSISYQVSPRRKNESVLVSTLFQVLRENFAETQIIDFQISQATLEDVFLNVVKKAEDLEIEQERIKSKMKDSKVGAIVEKKKGRRVKITKEKALQKPELVKDGNKFTYSNIEDQIIEEIDPEEILSDEENSDEFEADINFDDDDDEYNNIKASISDITTEQVGSINDEPNFHRHKRRGGCGNSIFCQIFSQTWFLFKKNIFLSVRGWVLTLVILLSPIVSMLAVFGLAQVTKRDDYIYHPEIINRGMAKCKTWGKNSFCVDFIYQTNDFDVGETIMNQIIEDYNFKNGTDYLKVSNITDWSLNNPNKTQMGIEFTDWSPHSHKVSYTLYYNATAPDFNEGDTVSQIEVWKVLIDNTIYKISGQGVKEDPIKVRYKPFPKLQDRTRGEETIWSNVGPQFFALSTLLLLIISIHKLVWEKEQRIKTGLIVIGMKKIPYYLSWYLVMMIYSAIMSLVAILSGMAFQIYPFIFGNQLLLFFVFFFFGCSLISLGFFLSIFINNSKIAIIFGFVVFSVCCIVDEFVGSGMIITTFMDKGSPVWTYTLFEIFYPTWNFAYIITQFIHKGSYNYDPVIHKRIRGPGFGFKDMFLENVQVFDFGLEFHTQPAYISFLFLIENIVLFLVLFAIGEFIIDYHNTGRSFRYFIYKLFAKPMGGLVLNPDQDLLSEYERINEVDHKNEYDLKLLGIKKYFYGLFGKTRAVREVNFGVKKNSCTALLGDNGAGKSTTINLVCGVYGLTDGKITLNGKSIRSNMNYMRRNVGVCHQTDILFDELTAKEHCQLFAEIKGLPKKQIKKEIENRLRQVSLWNVRNELSGTFSGGMKRRLSVALACIAEPKLILLDEPTTGLDPWSKRKVWELIFQMKKEKSVLFTSHSMEEAEALHDNICIITKGVLQCIGNSLDLKKKYGSCYVIKLTTNNRMQLEPLIKLFFESSVIMSKEEEEVVKIRIFPNDYGKLYDFFKQVEKEIEKKGCVNEFSVSPTSLEDVYVQATEMQEKKEKMIPDETTHLLHIN